MRSGNYHAIAEIMAMLAPILMVSPGGEDGEQSASSSSRRARTSGQYSQAVTATSSPYVHTPYEHYAMLLRYVLEFHSGGDSKVFSPELMETAVQVSTERCRYIISFSCSLLNHIFFFSAFSDAEFRQYEALR